MPAPTPARPISRTAQGSDKGLDATVPASVRSPNTPREHGSEPSGDGRERHAHQTLEVNSCETLEGHECKNMQTLYFAVDYIIF